MRVTFPAGAPTDLKGMDFSPDGSLYVGSVDGRIYSINTVTGVALLAVSTKISISGLAFDPASGVLWASIRTNPTLRDRIYKINTATGDTVGAGNTGFNQPLADLAYDASGNLFGLIGNPTSSLKCRLARINKVTGAGMEIGSVGLAGMVGIVFSPALVGTSADSHTSDGVVVGFGLEQNYPNPFNASTMIGYKVPGAWSGTWGLGSAGRRVSGGIVNSQLTIVNQSAASGSAWVRLSVYDILGREVAVLVNGEKQPGSYEVSFDGSGLASGMYIYRLSVGTFAQTQTMMLVR